LLDQRNQVGFFGTGLRVLSLGLFELGTLVMSQNIIIVV
jgi:hypothetical protein